MKLLKRLKRKKGFTLTEVMVAMLIFALMSSIVMQILAIAIMRYKKNDSIDKDMDAQISNLVQENALVERDTVDLVMKFVSPTGGTNNIKINDVKINKDDSPADSDGRLEINTIDATIKNDGGNKDKDKNSGGMVTDDIHIYGTKGIDKIIVTQETTNPVAVNGLYSITLNFTIDTTNSHALKGSEVKSLKVALPESSTKITVNPGQQLTYTMVSKTNIRFSQRKVTDSIAQFTNIKVNFQIPEDKFESEYGTLAKYFVKPDSTLTNMSLSFDDEATNGIYNHLYGTPVEGGYLDQICQGKYYNMPEELKWKDMEDKYQNPQRIVDRYRYFCQTHAFLGESFPNLNIDFGPGSLASYLGSEIGFKEDTVWFNKCLDGWDGVPKLTFDPENKWFKKHLQLAKDCQALAGDDFYVDMPDLMENIDVLASLRGAQDILFDLLDEPEMIGERIQEVTDIYYEYYDRFYDVIKDEEGGNAYTVFQIWGPGRTVKLQCDFSAMMSPEDFRKYIQPSLRSQSENVDHVLYHLDGPAAIKHMDALMEIEGIDALQWTSGDAGPDGTLPDWDVIYDKAIAAGKSIWVKVYSGEFEDWIRNVDRIVNKYGSHSLFLLFPEMSMEQAAYLLDYADRNWSDVKGTFVESLGR